MKKARRGKGFTLIELLVVVVVIGILVGVAVPNFIGATKKSRIAAVRANMHTLQVAAESAATDTLGLYPTIEILHKYMPTGGNDPEGADGLWPVNPFTNEAAPPSDAGLTETDAIQSAKTDPPGSQTGAPGDVAYSITTDTTSYAILGFDENGGSVPGGSEGMQLVMSNQ